METSVAVDRTARRPSARFVPAVALTLIGLAILTAAVLFARNAALATYPWINHDAAFHGYFGARIFEGERLYLEFQATNPPGSPLLLGALVVLARGLGLPPFLVIHAFVLLVGVAGLGVLRIALPPPEDNRTFALVALAYLVLVLRANFANSLYSGAIAIPYDFSQREHLFSLLFVPYLLVRLSGRRLSPWVVPYLALLGWVSGYKPYWPFMLVAVELVARHRAHRADRVVVGSLAAGLAAPLVLLALLAPASVVALFRDVIPMHLAGVYTHYDMEVTTFLRSAFHGRVLLGLVVFAFAWVWCRHRDGLGRAEMWLLAGLVALAYGAVFHQHKFWSYHAAPVFALTWVGTAWLVGRGLDTFHNLPGPRRAAAGLLMVGLAVAGGMAVGGLHEMLEDYPPLGHELVPLLRGHDPVMFFTTSVDFSYALLLLDVNTVGTWQAHYRLPELLALPDRPRREEALDRYASELTRNIDDGRPELLLVDPYRQALPPGRSFDAILRDLRVLPRPDYVAVPRSYLRGLHPRLVDWRVYRRRSEGPSS